MSNYKRLISYIYAYEGGVKGKNIGYAKLEIRGSQCRIQVSVKKIYVGSSEIGVYLLAPGAELLLGRIFIRGGAGEFRMQIDTRNVEGSGLEMEDFYGLTVHDVDSAWQCYTTIWEDAVAQTAELQLAEITAENVKKQEEGEKKADPLPISAEIEKELEEEAVRLEATAPWEPEVPEPETSQELVAAEEPETSRDQMEAGEPEASQEPEASEPEVSREQVEAGELETSQEQIEAGESETSREQVEAGKPEKGQEQVAAEELKTSREQMAAEGLEAGQEQVTELEVPLKLKPQEKEPAEPPQNPADAEIQDPAALAALDRQEQENAHRNNLWNRLERMYTKVLAFEYENDCQILSIKPQDIGLLPREIWMYGNNSFLLHGYYNYRHLILARLCSNQGSPRYLLGVPGHYFSNEKHMASMFGFPHFVLAKKQPEGDGRFGYWYTDIRL